MRWIGTDTLALACILASATAAGAATLGLLGEASGPTHQSCLLEASIATPTVVVTQHSHGHPESGCVVVKAHRKARNVVVHLQELETMEANLQKLETELQDMDVNLEGLDVHLEGMDMELRNLVSAATSGSGSL